MKDLLQYSELGAHVATVIALVYAGFQVYLMRKTHREDHVWNRRKSAQDIIQQINELPNKTSRIYKQFDILNRKDPIPLGELTAAFTDDPSIQIEVHSLLNSLNSTAIGIIKEGKRGLGKTGTDHV